MGVLDGLFSAQLRSAYVIPFPGKTYELHIRCGAAYNAILLTEVEKLCKILYSALPNVVL